MMMTVICSIAALFQRTRPPQAEIVALTPEYDFETVYQENFEFVWRTVRGLGVSPELVDDAAQEVFMVVHRKLAGYQPDASLRSWIFGIVRRVAKDFRRARSRRGVAVVVDESKLGTDVRDPYIQATQNQALQIVMDFADTLDEEWRSIFILSELEQLTTPEISTVLHLNLNTVYTRIRSIKKQLSLYVTERVGPERGSLYE